jgi:two-component system, NtrC family, response regulator AtoC
LGASLQSISPEALEVLQAYPWPGNVRELQNVIRQAIIVAAGPTILSEFLPADVQQYDASEAESDLKIAALLDSDWQSLPQSVKTWIANGESDVYRRAREQFDRLIIHEAMQHVDGNRSQAGRLLGLSHVTLRAKLRNMELPCEKATPKGETNQQPSQAQDE